MPREQVNSDSQPPPRVGNLARRRHKVVPDSMGGMSQPTPQVGNQKGRRNKVVLDFMESTSQLTPGAKANNHSGCRQGLVLGSMGFG